MKPSYPGNRVWKPAHRNNYTPLRNKPERIVVHVVQGSWASALNWFQNPSAQVAAHFTIASDGSVGQSLGDLAAGYHAGNWWWNTHSIGIEHGGYVDQPRYFTDEMLHASARLVAYKCKQYGIPVDRNHILAHSQIPGTTHTDPGPHWPWPRYMNLIRMYRWGKAPSPEPEEGVLYRPRSGLFSTMEGATRLAEIQQGMGLPASAEPRDGFYATYNGAFSKREGAKARLREAHNAGFEEAFIEQVGKA